MTYLDYQATTPLAPEALAAMLPWLEDQHANPHSPHRPGRAAKAAVEVARDRVAALLPFGGRVAFTGGATEALNWAIKGLSGPIVTIATEHAAVLDTAQASGRPLTMLAVGADGLVDPDEAAAAIAKGTAPGLAAAMLVNNETGVIQPVAALADSVHRAGGLLLCDAVQGYGRVPVPDGCDLVAVSAHKIYGPKGIGALWIRDGVELAPLIHGGAQEARRRQPAAGRAHPAVPDRADRQRDAEGALDEAQSEGIEATIYTHPIGFHGHAAGPTIGLWDQQGGVPGKGDYPLFPQTAYSIELNAAMPVPEWDGKKIRVMLEEDAYFDGEAMRYIDGRQTELLLIPRQPATP